MENYFYQCEVCGFVQLVPAYWMSFSPEAEYEMPHVNTETGEPCSCTILKQMEEA